MRIPEFATKEEKFKFLRENKKTLMTLKKSEIKRADSFLHIVKEPEFKPIDKSIALNIADINKIDVVAAINATNLIDSHDDVHIPGLWKKSVAETKNFLWLQEHDMQFDKVIADTANDELKCYTKNYTWAALGYPEYQGSTQVLIFDSAISKDRNAFMFNQYAKGYVTNHSIGMRYITLFFCMNSDSKYDQEEKANWDKYISMVANVQAAEDNGYFYAVTEAKIIEGSSVVKGSCYTTPTISVNESKIFSPDPSTEKTEPQIALEKQKQFFKKLIN